MITLTFWEHILIVASFFGIGLLVGKFDPHNSVVWRIRVATAQHFARAYCGNWVEAGCYVYHSNGAQTRYVVLEEEGSDFRFRHIDKEWFPRQISLPYEGVLKDDEIVIISLRPSIKNPHLLRWKSFEEFLQLTPTGGCDKGR